MNYFNMVISNRVGDNIHTLCNIYGYNVVIDWLNVIYNEVPAEMYDIFDNDEYVNDVESACNTLFDIENNAYPVTKYSDCGFPPQIVNMCNKIMSYDGIDVDDVLLCISVVLAQLILEIHQQYNDLVVILNNFHISNISGNRDTLVIEVGGEYI